MSIRHLDALFQPRSVAVVGASDRPGSIGAVVWRNLQAGGFGGTLWPVNPQHARIGDAQVWPDVDLLPAAPDLAVVCTPPDAVPGVIAQLGHKGTRAAIVLTAGLKLCPVRGALTLEQAMLDAARPFTLRVLGPNCIGLLVPGFGLNASFAPSQALPGKLAFVTQSGALATAMLDWATQRRVGFSHFVSLGDSADVDFGDVLDWLAGDAATRAILLYAESLKAGRKFMSAARAAARNKPVIIVKSGRRPEGARAAASHTGALAGSDAVADAAIRRAGMLRVDTLEDLFDAAETLGRAQRWRGPRLAIVTNGGGAGVLAADALGAGGGELAELSGETRAALDACLPSTWSHSDPVDIIGDAPVERYTEALRILLAADEVDGVLLMHAPTALVPAGDIAGACLPQLTAAPRPVLGCWMGGPAVAAARESWEEAGVPCFATPERAIAAWMQTATHAANQLALQQTPPAAPRDIVADREQAMAIVAPAMRDGREWLDEADTKALLSAYGIPVVQTARARDAEEAAQLAARIGFPVALKIVSQQVIHKSDVGGVVLGLDSPDAVRRAAIRMRQQTARASPQARVAGFTVQAMAVRPESRECIVGIATDPVFGPVLLFGAGGTDVELVGRHAIALPPLNALLARDLVTRSGAGPLLAAHRGRTAADAAALEDALLRMSQLACELEDIVELDINPLLVGPDGVLALDARARMRSPGSTRVPLAIRPYPEALAQTLQLGDSQLRVRPIRPEDGHALAAFYASASADDMRLRFFLAKRDVPPSELARYSQIDYDRAMTFVAFAPDTAGKEMRIAGEARALCDPDNDVAEFAIQVASDWQRRGLGRLLLDKLIAWLQARGTGTMAGTCLPENHGMVALARSAGFDVQARDDTLALRLPLVQLGPAASPHRQAASRRGELPADRTEAPADRVESSASRGRAAAPAKPG